jgi:putative ABC transport system substrate-binding protein
MNRRKILTCLLFGWSGLALSQTRQRTPAIGVPLIYAGPEDPIVTALREGLRERGYVDGENIRIEHRFGEGKIERLGDLIDDLVRAKVDIFVAGAVPIARALHNASASTPIVFVAWDYDPLTTGLVESLSRPGGNVTGIYSRSTETLGKRLQLLKELIPRMNRIAVIYDRWGKSQVPLLQAPARELGLQVHPVELDEPYDYQAAFSTARSSKAQAALVTFSPHFYVHRAEMARAAVDASLPTSFADESGVRAGGLMSYGPNPPKTWKRASYFIDRILKGDKPSELPMEQPQVFRFVLNVRTAKALRIAIPQALLMRADEVIG